MEKPQSDQGMSIPAISVILPVYNAEKYVGSAIQSVLDQSFGDFELIVINDGSTDGSEKVIRSFNDPRIVLVDNGANLGLIASLNKGIELARGEYIARMDADDVSLPERFELQKEFLDQSPGTDILASTIVFINENDDLLGEWRLDRITTSPDRIRKTMPKENCIAHPTVMGRVNIFRKYRYWHKQQNIEDYDLWLRLLADGKSIAKISRPLLYYRIHEQSITQSNRMIATPARRVMTCKRKYIGSRFKKLKVSWFDLRVAFFMINDFFVYFWKEKISGQNRKNTL